MFSSLSNNSGLFYNFDYFNSKDLILLIIQILKIELYIFISRKEMKMQQRLPYDRYMALRI